MMRSGENNHHVYDGYGKEMALSLNVKDTDEDKDEEYFGDTQLDENNSKRVHVWVSFSHEVP